MGTNLKDDRLPGQLRTRHLEAIALPKTISADHVEWLVSRIQRLSARDKTRPIRIIAMIENARGMVEIESIARSGKGYLDGLLVRSLFPSCKLGNR